MATKHSEPRELFLHLENYKSEWKNEEKLQIYEEQERAELVKIMALDPSQTSFPKEIDPVDSDVL